MAVTSSVLSVAGPNTGIVPGPTRMASAVSVRLDDVTGGTYASGAPASAPFGAADSVPPIPVDEWQAAPLARESPGPWGRAAGRPARTPGAAGPVPGNGA